MTRKTISAGLAALALACGGMLLSSAPASAVLVHRYVREINGSETPAKTFRPFGVAVDNATGASVGDVYVPDLEDGVVDKFGPLGEYKSQLTGFSTPLGADAVAVDNAASLSAEGAVYAADWGNGNVYKGETVFASGLNGASGVAIDQATGDVYVTGGRSEEAAARRRVYRFNASGTPLPSLEGFEGAQAVAVDNTCYYAGLTGGACTSADPSNGDLYVLDQAQGVVDEFDPGGKPLLHWSPAGTAEGIAVDPSSGHVYVASNVGRAGFTEGVVYEFSSSGALLGEITSHSAEYPTLKRKSELAPFAVAVGQTGDVYVGDVANRVVDVFGPDLAAPEAFTGSFSHLLPAGVTLEGEVNPRGHDTTSLFEYGACVERTCSPSDPYGLTKSTVQSAKGPSPGSADDGSGVVNVPVEASVTGLGSVPNQAYHYRLLAESAEIDAKSPPGEEKEFRTLAIPPVAESLQPSLVGFQAAVLSGSVNPENSETAYQFEYGLCETPEPSETQSQACARSPYPSRTPAQKSALYGVVDSLQEIEELLPSSVYHYRLAATNSAGAAVVSGPSEVTFTTAPAPPLVVESGAASAVTQTAAVISGTVDPNGLASSYGFQLGTQAGVYGPAIGLGRLGLGVYEPRTVTLALDDLQPGTTYHYRLVASNAYATVVGVDESFTTVGASSPFTQPLALALLATPVIAFPAEAKVTTVKALTRAQKLANALKVCKKKSKGKRASCKKTARQKYGPLKKK
jgi:hypothetical protein